MGNLSDACRLYVAGDGDVTLPLSISHTLRICEDHQSCGEDLLYFAELLEV
jgi:hypothetical protein